MKTKNIFSIVKSLKKRKRVIKTLKFGIFALFSILVIFLVVFGVYSIAYSKKIYLNQFVGNVNYSSKNQSETRGLITKNTTDFLNSNLILKYKNEGEEEKIYNIKPEDIALKFDIDKSLENIWGYGRNGKIINNFWQQISSIFKKTDHDYVFSLEEDSLRKKISVIAGEIDQPEQDYSLLYSNGEFILNADRKEGKRIDQELVIGAIKINISKTNSKEIILDSKNYKPQITEENAKSALKNANTILSAGDLSLEFQGHKFIADNATIGGLIKSRVSGNNLELIINEDRTKEFINSIAKSINTESQNTKLSVVAGQVKISTPAIIGKSLDRDQTKVDISNSLFARVPGNAVKADPLIISLKVEIKKPEITDDAISTLGISELVGTGTTDFRKSPSNRVHNIQLGATALNGALLKPGEEFSTLKRLGNIDATSGYLEELVIKENKTVPEFGGGLCQVSSTLFRATLNAGLKITERQNHKYRVSYYEPPVGMDATIYDPSPDLKFVNNYDKYILIQSNVTGTKITFEIYGTKDDRKVEISTPEMYDIVEPGAPIMVETDTLPPGEKKLTEKAHQGASAKFNYKVTRGETILQEKTFVSKYVPWPEKWLIGKGTVPEPTCTDTIQNGDETGVDCGGSCPNACPIS